VLIVHYADRTAWAKPVRVERTTNAGVWSVWGVATIPEDQAVILCIARIPRCHPAVIARMEQRVEKKHLLRLLQSRLRKKNASRSKP